MCEEIYLFVTLDTEEINLGYFDFSACVKRQGWSN